MWSVVQPMKVLLANLWVLCSNFLVLLLVSTNASVTIAVRVGVRRMGCDGVDVVRPAATILLLLWRDPTIFDKLVRQVLDLINGIADNACCHTLKIILKQHVEYGRCVKTWTPKTLTRSLAWYNKTVYKLRLHQWLYRYSQTLPKVPTTNFSRNVVQNLCSVKNSPWSICLKTGF